MKRDTYPENDSKFKELVIEEVDGDTGKGWSIKRSDGWSCWCPKESPIVPCEGMHIRSYEDGCTVRGLFIDGQKVFYRTESEQRERDKNEIEERKRRDQKKADDERKDRDSRWALLPEPFSKRRDRFMAGNPNFARDFESYELFCCEEAVAIFDRFHGDEENICKFAESEWENQKELMPNLSDDHSVNTFGFSCRLARWMATNPDGVEKEHGALTPLVGCEEYGCTHDWEKQ